MLYCKIAGDKSSEEVVEVVAVQSEAEGGGVTIFIPSLKRERDTELSRLAPIVEKKATLDTFFGKPKLELPTRPESSKMIQDQDLTLKESCMKCPQKITAEDMPMRSCDGAHYPWNPVRTPDIYCAIASQGASFTSKAMLVISKELYAETDNLHQADEVLLDNQRLLFNQLNSLKESLKVLQKKPVQEEREKPAEDTTELREELRRMKQANAILLKNQETMAKELQEMRAEMLMMREMLCCSK